MARAEWHAPFFIEVRSMRTQLMHSNPRARRTASGRGGTAGALVRVGVVLAVSLLSQPAWRAPAAAQVRPPVIRCVPPPRGMSFWLPFDHSYTDIVAGLNGTPQGTVSWQSGPPGRGTALSLAANGRVDYPASPATSVGRGDFSVDAWIRLPPTPGISIFLDNRVGTSQNLTGIGLFASNGNIGFQMANGGWSNFVSTRNVADNRWHFVVVTVARSVGGGHIYVDGNPVYTFNAALRPGSLGLNNHLAIGHDLYNNSQGSAFDIDEVEIFKRVLTSAEVTALYRYPKCRK
jgi:hypothetical protein